MPHGHFHWNELMTRDTEKAKKFYGDMLGWTFDEFPGAEGTYWVAMSGGRPAGGIFQLSGEQFENTSEHWTAYIEVDDVDARIQSVTEGGGSIIHGPFDMPSVGRIAMITDASGCAIGLITPAQ